MKTDFTLSSNSTLKQIIDKISDNKLMLSLLLKQVASSEIIINENTQILKQIIDKIFREKEEKIKKDFNKINKDFVRTKSHSNKPINYNSYFDRYILDLLGFK